MSTSRGNAVNLSDTPEEVRHKVNTAVTDPARLRSTDKGHPDICNVYQYHCALNEAEAPGIEERCRKGSVGCVACKERLVDRINRFLEPIRERRAFFEARPSIIRQALQDGIGRTLREAGETMGLVREALHFDYRGLL